jgi:hypothetical protein
MEWFDSQSIIEQIYLIFAIPSTILMLLLWTMTLLGSGHSGVDSGGFNGIDGHGDGLVEHGFDGHHGGTPSGLDFPIFGFRNLVCFFTLFGWVGFLCESDFHSLVTLLIALAFGATAMVLNGYILFSLTKLEHDGTMDINNAIGQKGEVYLPIQGREEKSGVVQVSIQGAVHELPARTMDGDTIPTGTQIQVVDIDEDNTLIVTQNIVR